MRSRGRPTKTAWAGWAPGRVVVFHDPAAVRAVIANPHPLAPGSSLAALWARSGTEPMRLVSVLDYSSRFTGVPSTGMIIEGRVVPNDPQHSRMVGRMQFASEDDATRALAAMQGVAARSDAPPGLAHVVALMQPRREGTRSSWTSCTCSGTRRPSVSSRR